MTVENLKQEEDFDGLLSQINSKSYRLSTRNLARYINQVASRQNNEQYKTSSQILVGQ